MYFDAQALVLTVGISIVFVSAAVTAHLVWITRLSRSPALSGWTRFERTAILSAAFVLPVISFYVVQVAAWWKEHAGRPDSRSLRPLAVAVVVTLMLAAFGAAQMESSYLPEYRDRVRATEVFAGQLLLLLITQVLLFMFVRVLFTAWRKTYVVSAAVVVVIYILLIT